MAVKINQFELENVKRIKAVALTPNENGLTVIGGKNGQGKTSVLDAITWALGGDRYRPSEAQRDGSVLPPSIRIELSNGLIVERKGKNSDLKVTAPDGSRSGQQLLNEFIEALALDLPKFMQMNNRDKAGVLLKIIGVGDELKQMESEEQRLYNERYAIGRIADQKKKYAQELTYYPEAPKEPVSVTELINRQQEILARNGENQRMRNAADVLEAEKNRLIEQTDLAEKELLRLKMLLSETEMKLATAKKTVSELKDESTAELEASIMDIEKINIKVRANLDRDKANMEAEEARREYDAITEEIERVREARLKLLNNAALPLTGLSVADGELTYNGFKWDAMSSSEQLKVATAIVRALNPKCGFVLLDKLEQMDTDTLKEFGDWLEKENLQVIATRVSTSDECSVIISDGEVLTQEQHVPRSWKNGEF